MTGKTLHLVNTLAALSGFDSPDTVSMFGICFVAAASRGPDLRMLPGCRYDDLAQ